MFKRTKSEPETAPIPVKEGGKGRPTPTRREAEAAAKARAKGPQTRKERNKRDREQRYERSQQIRQAMKTGDERYLLPRDKGPVRKFIRDFVDVRFSIVEMMIPLLIVSMVLSYTGNSTLMQASSLILMATLLFVVGDMFFMRFRLRRELGRRFPDEPLKGTTWYAVMRSLQMKFMRMPKARLKIGAELPNDYR